MDEIFFKMLPPDKKFIVLCKLWNVYFGPPTKEEEFVERDTFVQKVMDEYHKT